MKSTRLVILGSIVLLVGIAQTRAKDNPPLKLAETIALPGLKDGDFAHFALDLEGHRLFLTGEENDKVLVFDTSTNKLIHTIEESKAPHAILYRGDLKKLFVVEGDALDRDELEAQLERLGDSLLVVGDATALKVHIHTDDPGAALTLGTTAGTIDGVEIANIQEQQEERERRLSLVPTTRAR